MTNINMKLIGGLAATSTLFLAPAVAFTTTTHHANAPSPILPACYNFISCRADTSLRVLGSKGERGSSSSSSLQHTQTGPLFSSFAPDQPTTAAGPENNESSSTIIESILSSYAGPRLILVAVAMIYGTNFPLGALMANAMPASAVTSSRFFIAAIALLPYLPKISPKVRLPALLGGCVVSLGYVAQSLALVQTAPATVSFLGVATPIVVCPLLEAAVDGKPMSLWDAPQTWLAALLCIAGVGILELMDPTALADASSVGGATGSFSAGGMLSLLAGFGFGSGCYLNEKMMRDEPEQALPITAVIVSTTALLSVFWSLANGWMTMPGGDGFRYTLPGLLSDPSLTLVALAVVWTGLISTSLNNFVEISALGRVPSAEASVILATEPLAAATFGAIMLQEEFGMNDYVGGFLVIAACLVNTLKPEDIMGWINGNREKLLKSQ